MKEAILLYSGVLRKGFPSPPSRTQIARSIVKTMDVIKRYSAIRTAFKAFPANDEKEARKSFETNGIIGFSESLEINKALSVVRTFLEKLDLWEREHG